MMRAGVGLSAAPFTCRPAAQRMPARMSLSRPPHLPSTRTGRMYEFQLRPATPAELLVSAPIMPATRVPCQVLEDVSQLAYMTFVLSLASIQSPGSDGSVSRASPSLDMCAAPTKSKPGSRSEERRVGKGE